jgi:hypothetical protein
VIECPASGQPFYGQDAQYVTNPMSFTVGLDGFTVTDNVTGLVWQREDDNSPRTWGDAISYCEGLDLGGHTDWRLPAVKELQSIVDYGRYSPSIDALVFPEAISDCWSSSTHAYSTRQAWDVDFSYGHVGKDDKSDANSVRCVR